MAPGLFSEEAGGGHRGRLIDQIAGEMNPWHDALHDRNRLFHRRAAAQPGSEERQLSYRIGSFGVRPVFVELIGSEKHSLDDGGRRLLRTPGRREKQRAIGWAR